jgi:hypothetical protein
MGLARRRTTVRRTATTMPARAVSMDSVTDALRVAKTTLG